jgi:GNAT superfamily N-acetyltransferase
MRVIRTKYFLEMTSAAELVPGREPPSAVEWRELTDAQRGEAADVFHRVGHPYGWTRREDAAPRRDRAWQGWLPTVHGRVAGVVELDADGDRNVEISTFGLAPEFVGLGYGGHVLTVATELAWAFAAGDMRVRRVWLTTTSLDHPNALSNYLRRGFRQFDAVVEEKDIPVEVLARSHPELLPQPE